MTNRRKEFLALFLIVINLCSSNACWMDDINSWDMPQGATIADIFRGNIFEREIRDIDSIISVVSWEGLNSGPYVTATLTDSRFILATNDAYENYEEYETVNSMSVTVTFRCSEGSDVPLRFIIEVEDTNNNAPRFLPSDQLDFTIYTPLPPGSLITGCFDGITVRDIDLTTVRIDFSIEENPYFEIIYDADASNTDKEFVAVLKTTTFVRSLPEPITLVISATDVDLTGDPPLTTTANVIIRADAEFELPEEPVFTQAYYFADYINNNEVVLLEIISLQSGFDDLVEFSLEGEYASNFQVIPNGNQLLLSVVTPLLVNIIREQHIFLVMRAEREHTSGDSAAIVVRLPEEIPLEFERAYYEGTIDNNVLQDLVLILSRGYEGADISVQVLGEYSSFFTTNIQENSITLLMEPLNNIIINENNILVLEIAASSESNSASTIVTLEIIKDDTVTPVFNRPLYEGSYNSDMGLILEEIVFDQGYDDTVELSLEGEYEDLFAIRQEGSVFTLTTTNIPSAIFSQQRIILTLQATKPRTVGANAVIIISLPAAQQLRFEESNYRGTLQDNTLSLDPIVLSEGYDENIIFTILGDYSNYFALTSTQNLVTISLGSIIPENIILENSLIILTVEASGLNAITTATSVLVDIIKEDVTTPVFSRNIYYGTYQGTSNINLEDINLTQGFGDDVIFSLEGDHSQYFGISNTGNDVIVSLTSDIPEEVIYDEKVLQFNVVAIKPLTVGANAAIVIRFSPELTEPVIMRFSQNTYNATLENNVLRAYDIVLSTGYQIGTEFLLTGDHAPYFTIRETDNVVSLLIVNQLSINEIENSFIVLELEARRDRAVSTWTSIVIYLVKEEVQSLVFSNPYYQGIYNEELGTLSIEEIVLASGYDDTVTFELEGDFASWFAIADSSSNSASIVLVAPIPSDDLQNINHILFAILATKPNANNVHAAISITVEREILDVPVLVFDRVTYVGSIENTVITLDPITLIEGYTDEVHFDLQGELASYFTLSRQGTGVIIVMLPEPIPEEMLPANRLILLDIRALASQAQAAQATIVFEIILEDDLPAVPQLIFNATYYTGTYTHAAGVTLDTPMSLAQGYDETVAFALEGDQARWFMIQQNDNALSLIVISSIPSAVLANNAQLVFVITAQRLRSDNARATIVITVTDEVTDGLVLGFDRVTYVGSIESNLIKLDPITLIEGYTNEVTFSLHGDLASYFALSSQGAGVVIVTLPQPIPDEMIPVNRLILLDIRASAPQAQSAHATIVFEVILEDDLPAVPQLIFNATYYTGTYTHAAGVTLDTPMSLAQGYDETVAFALEGDQARWFMIEQNDNALSLIVMSSIPSAVLANNAQLVFVITAQRLRSDTARATIVIILPDDSQTEEDVLFDKLVYEGIIQISNVQHEVITINNYDGVNVQLHGEYSSLFVADTTDGVVAVQASESLNLPYDVTHVVLELHAADARAVLLLSVIQTDFSLPSVTFSSSSYVLNVEIVQTGLVGRVQATSDNGESITYSLSLDNAHLQTRISINNEGELFLSAPANSGVYTFQVIATTVITQAEATAVVYLTVEALTACGNNEIVVPPLIILDRDEEEPHSNLVTLNTNQYESCHFTLSNRWPHNQDWLYVDETGLHARSIDREHESIAFMALSQIQVELILHCENDATVRSKRSVRTDWLGPYDYGTSTWILTESIPYNSRRSLVNLIVNDINDNYPIFIGKESEPITVGYPNKELEDRILPRSLAELQATDADIGENAALMYWSSEDVLAVEPTTGFVHVRSGAQLQNNQILTVRATDQNGQGLTGDIQLMVKLLDVNNILIITVRDAFLNDENQIMTQLSQAVGYELKTLKSVVISDDLFDKEDVLNIQERSTQQTSLLLYVYGLIEREPVLVDRLSMDINNNSVSVNIINTISLEDYIELEIMVERDIGFMVATIVLSILLFIIIALVCVWLFIKWWRNRNYDKFSDENSLASRSESPGQLPKPNTGMPRINIEELIKSEKRLQDMLSAPIEEVSIEPVTPRKEVPVESVLDLSLPEHSTPIVIQSIDKLKNSDDTDDDEFGESSGARNKSVVTFNENVEKIIHVEDNDDDDDTISSQASYEIYKL